jgi:tetratricopeptide (TPR) repeat protein
MLNDVQQDAASEASPVMGRKATADAGPGLAALLRPESGTVAFTGRAGELEELRAWRASNPVRVLCGEAGVGKTRLALEIAAEHNAAGGTWRPVPVGQEADAIRAARAASAGPLLLIVERAETREGLDELLRAALKDPGPVRVLLIARALGEWWDKLIEASDPAVSRLLSATEPLRLAAPVSENASDADLAKAAVPHFAQALSVDAPERVTVEPADRRVPLLVIHAATVLALLRFSTYWVTSLRVVIDDHALEDLLEYEAHYWQRAASAAGLPARAALVKQLIAASSLLGATSVAEAADVTGRVPGLADCPYEQRVRWAQWLERLCPVGPDGRLGVLQPDMLAESHVVSQLAADSHLAQSCLRGLPAEQAERALAVLARACGHQDHGRQLIATALRDDLAGLAIPAARVALQDAGDLGDLLADALDDAPASAEVLTEVALGMPYPSVVLALAHLTATTRVRESLPDDTEPETLAEWDARETRLQSELGSLATRRKPNGEAAGSQRETAAGGLGARVSEPDRPADALAAAQQAVTTCRELADADPGRYRADLASSLANLGARLSEADRPADALAAGQEAVAIHRELADADPGRYHADLASSLVNLGVWFSEVDRLADAVQATGEAITAYRKLDSASAGNYSTDLAAALTNLGRWLSGLGRPKDAVAAGQEALGIRRELAAAGPDSSRADLATCLISLGAWYSELSRPEDALAAEQEAVTIWRVLAAFAPARYRPDLAASLANFGITLSELGRPEDALAAVEEAVTVYRELAAASPEYRRELARALSGLAAALDALGRDVPEWDASEARLLSELGSDAAAQPAKQLASPRRLISRAIPAGARHDPGASPAGLAAEPADLASPGAAPATPTRRTDPRTPDRETTPTSTHRVPAASPTTPAAEPAMPGLPGKQDRSGARKQSARKAARPRRADSRADRGRARPDSRVSAASDASDVGAPAKPATPAPRADPQAAGQEAADPGRPLAAKSASAAAQPSERTRPEDPATGYLEAVAAYRQLADTHPGRYRADLATALFNLGLRLSRLGRIGEALQAGQEALTIRRELDEADPDGFRGELATCLASLGIWYSELGRTGDALKAEQEAVSIRRELVAIDPVRYRSDLAASLASLGITLSELGRPATALGPMGEAATIYRDLAATDPGRYHPELARCLASLALRYARLDRPAEALPPSEEAVTIRRELARVNPRRHLPNLARSLVNLGFRYCELRRWTDAVPPAREAVTIYRELVAASPGYRRELARALGGLAAALAALGRDTEAERAEGEAAEITRELKDSHASRAR